MKSTNTTIQELKDAINNHELTGTFQYPDTKIFSGIVKDNGDCMTIDGMDIPYENLTIHKNTSLNLIDDPKISIATCMGCGEIKVKKTKETVKKVVLSKELNSQKKFDRYEDENGYSPMIGISYNYEEAGEVEDILYSHDEMFTLNGCPCNDEVDNGKNMEYDCIPVHPIDYKEYSGYMLKIERLFKKHGYEVVK